MLPERHAILFFVLKYSLAGAEDIPDVETVVFSYSISKVTASNILAMQFRISVSLMKALHDSFMG